MTQGSPKRVAVIGAGISGVCAAVHLLKHGLEVVVFERSGIAGGAWHFDERTAPDPTPYPNEVPSKGDYEPIPDLAYSTPPPEDEDSDELEIAHAPPGPCYAGLKNNVSTREMKTSLGPWPAGCEDFVSQHVVDEYIQGLAEQYGVNSVTQYHTRVEEVRKVKGEWMIRTTRLQSKPRRRLVATFMELRCSCRGLRTLPNATNTQHFWPGRVESRISGSSLALQTISQSSRIQGSEYSPSWCWGVRIRYDKPIRASCETHIPEYSRWTVRHTGKRASVQRNQGRGH